ncbi:hypothetical protein [Halosimplex pelagicum]|uniref:DUF86 domain-containing protein n=1 Tax=Halosimplex pelagicum TaxID=869886 RepID=A0A7D5TC68_9EURY|nr:hypothetical protein [Halosimplex pelagicum]QLH82793.1 hypothetical protein HZS54_14700 [Halosimplex pelagicum]
MSQHNQEDTEEIEDDTLALADPDDYHRSQRLREIHKARRNVHDTLNSIERFNSSSDHSRQQLNLADAVSLYASELLPPATDADLDTTLPDAVPWDTLEEYARLLGHGKDADVTYQHHNIIFQECNRLLADLKPLIEDNDSDEWEV